MRLAAVSVSMAPRRLAAHPGLNDAAGHSSLEDHCNPTPEARPFLAVPDQCGECRLTGNRKEPAGSVRR